MPPDRHVEEPSIGARRGRYTNYFEIRFTAEEFLFDLGEHYPESAPPLYHTRIVTTVDSARVLAALLQEALQRHHEDIATTEAPA